MDVAFVLSKLAALVFLPSNLILLGICSGLALQLRARLRQTGVRISVLAAAAYACVALAPVGPAMLSALETRFPALDDCPPPADQDIVGVILLGGGVDPFIRNGRLEADLNDGADRLFAAARLAHAYPSARILVSGGNAFDADAPHSEASAMRHLLIELGVSPSRIIIEDASRTTAENAAGVARLTPGGAWLLVTSAFHMPRAVGTFRKAGLHVIAAPTDWRVRGSGSPLTFSAALNLQAFDMAVREMTGLVGYWATGRSTSVWPGPDRTCAAIAGSTRR